MEILKDKIFCAGLQRAVRLLLIGDTHISICDARESEEVRAIVARRRRDFDKWTACDSMAASFALFDYARASKPDCVVFVGDVFDFPAALAIERVQDALGGVPYVYAPGNHDWADVLGVPDAAHKMRYRRRLEGFARSAVDVNARTVCGLRLVGADNALERFDPGQAEKMRAEFAGDEPCVLFVHVPFYADTLRADVLRVWKQLIVTCAPDDAAGEELRVRDAVAEYSDNIAAVLAGHVHFAHDDMLPTGVRQLIAPLGAAGKAREIMILPKEEE